jgi:hypothetical protein
MQEGICRPVVQERAGVTQYFIINGWLWKAKDAGVALKYHARKFKVATVLEGSDNIRIQRISKRAFDNGGVEP